MFISKLSWSTCFRRFLQIGPGPYSINSLSWTIWSWIISRGQHLRKAMGSRSISSFDVSMFHKTVLKNVLKYFFSLNQCHFCESNVMGHICHVYMFMSSQACDTFTLAYILYESTETTFCIMLQYKTTSLNVFRSGSW